jgi:hypothetical protein
MGLFRKKVETPLGMYESLSLVTFVEAVNALDGMKSHFRLTKEMRDLVLWQVARLQLRQKINESGIGYILNVLGPHSKGDSTFGGSLDEKSVDKAGVIASFLQTNIFGDWQRFLPQSPSVLSSEIQDFVTMLFDSTNSPEDDEVFFVVLGVYLLTIMKDYSSQDRRTRVDMFESATAQTTLLCVDWLTRKTIFDK